MATYKGTKGVDPTKTGENRVFWHDRFVEPKQQHRFTIRFPVYTPVGKNKDVVELVNTVIPDRMRKDDIDTNTPATAAASALDTINAARAAKKLKLAESSTDLLLGELAEYVDLIDKDVNSPETRKRNGKISQANGYRSENIYLRLPEYIGYSFKPPGFGYQPKADGEMGNAQTYFHKGAGKLNRSPVNLSFVTSLRDDMHFSLNFLWQLGWGYGGDGENAGVQVFPDSITDLEDNEKYVVVYEYYARQTKDGNGKSINNINDDAVSGIHKIKNPSIQSVEFSEFSYAGAELIKVNVVLVPGEANTQKDFYSYQNTEARYLKDPDDPDPGGTIYATDEGDYAKATGPGAAFRKGIYPSAGPLPGSKRFQVAYETPNTGSSNPELRDLSLGDLKRRKNNFLIEKNIKRIETIRIIEGDSNIDKNSLVTKGISETLAAREDSALDEQRDNRLLDRADKDAAARREKSHQASEAKNQKIYDHIAKETARLKRERAVDELSKASAEYRTMQKN